MPRATERCLTRGMAALGLVEAALSFAAIYAVTTLAGSSMSLPDFVEKTPYDYLALAAVLIPLAGAPLAGGIGLTIGFCRTYVSPRRKRLFATSGLAAATACAFLLAMSGDARTGFSVVQALFTAKLLVAWLTAMTLIRLIYGLTGLRAPPARRILLVGNALQTKAFSIRLRSRRDLAFDPVVFAAPEISWLLLRQHRIWGVIITSEPDSSAVQTLLDCKLRGTKICSAAAFYENHLGRIDLDMFSASEWLMTPGFPAGGHNAALKRLSDIIVGVALLWLTLPVMALTMLAIKIDSSGPVFYRQQRVGQFGKPFTLLKFRSMTVDAEAGGNPVWAQRNDPRVTRVGRFIRATRIDELPQLANVLVGEMSLVGPRPERPHFVEQLSRAIPFYRQRSYVKPGVTGWAQINFPYGASVEDAREKLAYDLYYVKNRSLLLDVLILFATVRVILFREGAR
jgi:exopolysaccharide biosynthesis polyprenyl glycosylphosphotransferase